MDYYTFLVVTNNESSNFYNLVVSVDENSNILGSKIMEYIPNDNWINDPSLQFEGQLNIHNNGIFNLDDIDSLINLNRSSGLCFLGANNTLMCNYNVKGHYEGHPDCNLATDWWVNVELQWGPCPGPDDPSFDPLTQTEPIQVPISSPSGGGGVGGGSPSNPEDDCTPSIDNPCNQDETVILTPIHVDCHLPESLRQYDLDENCHLSEYETCLMNGINNDVCSCMRNGGTLEDCIEEDDCNTFEERMIDLFDTEGGYVNDPADPGGPTNKGISWSVWQENAQSVLGVEPTLSNLQNLTTDQAKLIYKSKYWDSIYADDIVDGDLRWLLFDFNVNAGGNAVKVLQSTLNELGVIVIVDGAMGNQTISAINDYEDQIQLYNLFKINRLNYYIDITEKSVQRYLEKNPNATDFDLNKWTYVRFINGWTNRVNEFIDKSIENYINVNC
jgi:lysozyme family protein